jgi:hypothetical protein
MLGQEGRAVSDPHGPDTTATLGLRRHCSVIEPDIIDQPEREAGEGEGSVPEKQSGEAGVTRP